LGIGFERAIDRFLTVSSVGGEKRALSPATEKIGGFA